SPISGEAVKKDTVTDVVNFIMALPDETQVTVLCPLYPHNNRSLKEELAVLMQKGFVRVEYKGKLSRIEDLLEDMSIVDDGSWLEDEMGAKSGKHKAKSPEIESEIATHHSPAATHHAVRIVIDRISKNDEDETVSRLGDSIQTAFFEGKGDCFVRYQEAASSGEQERFFCDRFELDGIRFEEPTP